MLQTTDTATSTNSKKPPLPPQINTYPKTKLGWALWLGGRGFKVTPLPPNEKKAPEKGWINSASDDPSKIRFKWKRDRDQNIAISTTEMADGRKLLIVDVDIKGGAKGIENLALLKSQGIEFPDTFTVKTPSGGFQLYYWTQANIAGSASKIARGIDIRAHHCYTLGPGSSIDGKFYEIVKDLPIAEAKNSLIDICSRPIEKDPKAGQILEGINSENARSRAIDYLEHNALIAKEDGTGDNTTYKVANAVMDYGVDKNTALQLMLEHWNDRCEPPWNSEDLLKKVENAAEYRNEPVGVRAPETQFEPIVEEAPPYVQKFNEDHFVVNESGKAVVYRYAFDPSWERKKLERIGFEDFKKLHMNDLIHIENKRSLIPSGKAWLSHKLRRQYLGGVAFAPGKDLKQNYFNLWQGFGVEPKQGDWSKFRNHIEEVICNGDLKTFTWLMGWLARLFQYPGTQGEVAPVLRGGRGVGKGTFGNTLLRLMGQHGLYITNSKHLVGNFNAHLRDCLFAFVDEAFFAGDRTHESVLKGLITDPYILVEGKYQNAVTVKNMAHILMASNESWVVPAGTDERRFCLLDVSDQKKQDKE